MRECTSGLVGWWVPVGLLPDAGSFPPPTRHPERQRRILVRVDSDSFADNCQSAGRRQTIIRFRLSAISLRLTAGHRHPERSEGSRYPSIVTPSLVTASRRSDVRLLNSRRAVFPKAGGGARLRRRGDSPALPRGLRVVSPKGKRLTTFCASLTLLHPLLSLTHWIFGSLSLSYKSSSHSAKCVRCASLRSGGESGQRRLNIFPNARRAAVSPGGDEYKCCCGSRPPLVAGATTFLHGKASHTILRSLALPYSTAITDSQYFVRRFAPTKYVRWCDSCSLATPQAGAQQPALDIEQFLRLLFNEALLSHRPAGWQGNWICRGTQ